MRLWHKTAISLLVGMLVQGPSSLAVSRVEGNAVALASAAAPVGADGVVERVEGVARAQESRAQESRDAGSAAQAAESVLLVAVSRQDALLADGIGSGRFLPPGVIDVEPIARITPDGRWLALPCATAAPNPASDMVIGAGNSYDPGSACQQFVHGYLNQIHSYTVVSSYGFGLSLTAYPLNPAADPATCLNLDGTGSYMGSSMPYSAVAAPDAAAFTPAQQFVRLRGKAYRSALAHFAAVAPIPLASMQQGVRFYAVSLDGRQLIVVERSFTDFSSTAPSIVANLPFVLAIGEMAGGHFHLLFWKRNLEQESEQLIGNLKLRSGQEFLVTSVNTSEAQFFRVYGVRRGEVQMVFEGGGSGQNAGSGLGVGPGSGPGC